MITKPEKNNALSIEWEGSTDRVNGEWPISHERSGHYSKVTEATLSIVWDG